MRTQDISVQHLLARSESRLGVREVIGVKGLSNRLRRVQIQHYDPVNREAPLIHDVIMIIPPVCDHPLTHGDFEARLRFLEEIRSAKIPCIFMSAPRNMANHLRRDIEQVGIPHVVSIQDAFLLESRLKSVLREKMEHRITMHGVLLKMFGLGVMIRGDSGAGKTTLGMKLVWKGHTWIADDIIEIEKMDDRCLNAQGMESIRHLVDLKGSGVRHAKSIFADESVADGTNLHLVLEIEGREGLPVSQMSAYPVEFIDIMGSSIPCVHIPGYGDDDFDLLKIEKWVRAFKGTGEAS